MEVSFPLSACLSVGNLRSGGLGSKTSAVTVKLDKRAIIELFGMEEKESL